MLIRRGEQEEKEEEEEGEQGSRRRRRRKRRKRGKVSLCKKGATPVTTQDIFED
jgi:hypothetical protein